MAENRLVGDYPVIGIRATIDGRRGVPQVRESPEEPTTHTALPGTMALREIFSGNHHLFWIIFQ